VKVSDLRHRVTFQQDNGTQDSGGFITASWGNISTDPTVWAKIKTMSAAERFQAGQIRVEATHEVTIRERSDLTSNMRISTTLHGDARVFLIKGIRREPDEMDRQWLVLTVEERASE